MDMKWIKKNWLSAGLIVGVLLVMFAAWAAIFGPGYLDTLVTKAVPKYKVGDNLFMGNNWKPVTVLEVYSCDEDHCFYTVRFGAAPALEGVRGFELHDR